MMVIRRSFGPFNMDKRPMHANNTGKDTYTHHLVCQLPEPQVFGRRSHLAKEVVDIANSV